MRKQFTRNTLALAIGMALTGHALAQDGIEQITVTGSRASLQSAIQKQRASDKVAGVVDSDALGNFADINVAESLRRIAGIPSMTAFDLLPFTWIEEPKAGRDRPEARAGPSPP